jgi:hypothetical protein
LEEVDSTIQEHSFKNWQIEQTTSNVNRVTVWKAENGLQEQFCGSVKILVVEVEGFNAIKLRSNERVKVRSN